MKLITKKGRNKFLVMGVIIFMSLSHQASAQTGDKVLSPEELSTRMLELEKEVKDLKMIVQQQNEIIKKLSAKAEGPKTENIAAVPEKPKEEKSPVFAGMGKVDLSVLLQEWYVHDDHAKDNFKHRRLELGLGGKLEDHLLWKVQIDPSLVQEDNTTRSILKDAYVGYDGISHHVIQWGQVKIPITEEGFRSSAKIDTIERSFIGRTFGDKRDIGLMALGTWKYADYQLGVFNGEGPNKTDTNDQKDLAGRLVLKPFPDKESLKGFQMGSSFYVRPANKTASEKKRLGAEAHYENGPFSLKAEFMKGQDAAVPVNGWYIQTGYFFLPQWQAVSKYEGFDPNERKDDDREYDTTVGLNYFLIEKKTKLQLNYIHKKVIGGTDDNQVIGAVQYAF